MSSASCDDSSGVNFSYTPLRPEKSEIRLLRAQPGELDAEIQPFDLHNISLNDYPSYIALSYTWGDPTPREIIYVNGKALLETKIYHGLGSQASQLSLCRICTTRNSDAKMAPMVTCIITAMLLGR